ncbi:uncharacterized protein MAM_01328 [Metarhizium album ARSEF 1941]|uniref:SRm160/300 splicing coactivator n=1 Tax=Metarhizium album (strain ARSEF 1941) TaxID=1081103 RepID=A0A0B2X519_METAS|nr:uncharacterized protein MAM_01328 [Metarhizium album ARSEF 1941]KHO00550.1 hypothetical protein MAM_01328 [Metarhizium album ARSEF 1941]
MPSSIAPDDDVSQIPTTPSTPSKASRANTNTSAETPTNGNPSPRAEPNPTPPAVATKARPRSDSKKEPTLLTDFLRGKQSAARLAADRKRRQSIEAVKAELRQEMRQSPVRKLQQPGGVRERVQKWQKANASSMAEGDPSDAATEPTEVAFKGEDEVSVTESDRIRIKFRQKRRSDSRPKAPPAFLNSPTARSSTDKIETDNIQSTSPPKKRVVSDEHWRKPRARKSPPRRRVSPSNKKLSPSPTGLPKDFVRRSGGNPLVSNKIKEWAARIEIPESPRSHGSPKAKHRSARSDGAKSEAGDSVSDITAKWAQNRESRNVDGIRIKPLKPRKLDDDGIRISSPNATTAVHDDGIRIRPISEPFQAMATRREEKPISRSRRKTTSDSGRPSSPSGLPDVKQDSSDLSQQTGSRTSDELSKSDANEDPDSVLDTPPKGRGSRRQKAHSPELSKTIDDVSYLSEEQSNISSMYKAASDLASSVANKSIADLPGDIPFGHSAFSELDLTIDGQPRSRPKRTKVDRTTSLKSVPKVFKKVVQEGKKIIHEMNEPPKQIVSNKPPSIEKWLNTTVDPFVDSKSGAESKPPSPGAKEGRVGGRVEEDRAKAVKPRGRGPHGAGTSQHSASGHRAEADGDIRKEMVEEEHQTPVSEATKGSTTPPSSGLKRSRAVRSSSSPLKAEGARRQLFGALKEAFQGESGPHPVRPKSYQSTERKFLHTEDVPQPLQIRKSMPPPPSSKSLDGTDISPQTLAAPRLPPPTSGDHELSTILSEESSSAVDSDLTSDVSQSTLTQSTTLTKDSGASKSAVNPAGGLKRRLTKHSDLVSVLSLPDDSSIPKAVSRYRCRPSLRKRRSASCEVASQELLREFIDDENLYLRELKTLVDGVVPVLLSHVVSGTNVTELFGPSASGQVPDCISKSVVNMGVALEKLKSAHKKAPTTDIRKMANWAHGVVPMYNSYIKAWRLGFDDVVVNLAPAADGMDDGDSLLNALPRNEKGDIVNSDGERVAVAHLLKRPLMRVKQIVKLMRCVDSIIGTNDTRELLRDFEDLQDKARRRYREETARLVDEEAASTSTSRCRDLGTLDVCHAVLVEPSRQVNAKDMFSLSLCHSNSQRLDCQVELIYRDNQADTTDEGDVLIREKGEGRKSYLLFPPISMSMISARTGGSSFDIIVMVRGTSKEVAWREVFTLTADNENQILDWLDILPSQPIPPTEFGPLAAREAEERPQNQPRTPTRWREPSAGAAPKSSPEETPRSPIAKDVSISTPTSISKETDVSNHHPVTSTPRQTSPSSDSKSSRPPLRDPDKTPTKDDPHATEYAEGRGRPLKESMRPDPRSLQPKKQVHTPNTSPCREDGAPPPPIHRSLSTSPKTEGGDVRKSAPAMPPPAADQHGSDRLKRRGSSPLKHEYLPSDQSSTSEAYSTEESEVESSDDEMESPDIPETEVGVSIKEENVGRPQPGVILMPESECSLTPSHSASQAGPYGHSVISNEPGARYMARISRWSEKGVWKDIMADPCSVVVTNGLIEAYSFRTASDTGNSGPPLVALDLTPLVLIRQSTAVDLEIRSSVQSHSRLYRSHSGGNFRFRCFAASDCYGLYMSVHQARLQNQKFIQLENEARFKGFGERGLPENDGETSSQRRSWFGRQNSYRSSIRAPSQSHDGASTTPSSTPSASSFLKRLTMNGNMSFNIAKSSIDRRSWAGSGVHSLYASGSSSSAGGTPPRSPSVSIANDGQCAMNGVGTDNIRIRLHLLVTSTKWEDYGNCSLQIRRPPPGWRQALRADHGLEKRITVTTLPRKDSEEAKIVLDAVLGSGCFSSMGSRGIVCGVWEEVKNGDGVVGMVPETGATGGNIKKWCFQFSNAAEANGVLTLVHQEVLRA